MRTIQAQTELYCYALPKGRDIMQIHRLIFIIVTCSFLFCVDAEAGRSRGSSHSRSTSSYRSHTSTRTYHSSPRVRRSPSSTTGRQIHTSTKHRSSYSATALRDSHGRIKRSETATRDFKKQTGYPHGRKGFVIDHVIPLAKGGADSPSNMQWQTKADAKAKDKWERK